MEVPCFTHLLHGIQTSELLFQPTPPSPQRFRRAFSPRQVGNRKPLHGHVISLVANALDPLWKIVPTPPGVDRGLLRILASP